MKREISIFTQKPTTKRPAYLKLLLSFKIVKRKSRRKEEKERKKIHYAFSFFFPSENKKKNSYSCEIPQERGMGLVFLAEKQWRYAVYPNS